MSYDLCKCCGGVGGGNRVGNTYPVLVQSGVASLQSFANAWIIQPAPMSRGVREFSLRRWVSRELVDKFWNILGARGSSENG